AVVAAGLRTRQFLKPVKRPGIAVPLPTSAGRSVLMDCGANPHAKPEHLFQYGVIGAVYAREILGIERPRIGTLNIGSEEGKGNELVGETHELFKSAGSLPGEYVGYVEGRGIYHGEADVTVCEGFVGNVVLKVSEGFAQYLLRAVGEGLVGAGVLGPEDAMKTVGGVGRRFAYQATGGAPLLGVDGACLIAHGSSDGDAIANAIKAAAEMVSKDVNGQIVAALGG
ncbi:MAG: phosphate acyltransferase PlsX, partial [Planctomycetota bacterium]